MTIDTAAAKPRRKWLRRLAWLFGLVALIAVWWTQPHFGANVCILEGFKWETDFVEDVRPTVRKSVERGELRLKQELPAGVTVAQIAAVVDEAVDLFKQCVAERGVHYCRYVGPDPNGIMMFARTVDGPNAIEQQDEYKYRYIKTGLDYEISIIPQHVEGSLFSVRVWRFGKRVEVGGKLCYLGCDCNPRFGP
jgi:hypothetical protein